MLPTFAARVCQLQLNPNRHFLLEVPAGSGIFSLVCLNFLREIGKLVSFIVPHSVLGLVVGGGFIYKNSILLASSILLLKTFEKVKRIRQHHGSLMGRLCATSKAKLAQVWPRDVCQRMCNGIQALLKQSRRVDYLHAADSCPIGLGKRSRGRPRKTFDGVVIEKHGVIYDCFGCAARRHTLHPSHIRNGEPPLLCRRYRHEFSKWSCEACLRVFPGNDPSRTCEEGCR